VSEARCACPTAYPDWDGQDISLAGHCVHVQSLPTLFHMPLAYDLYLRKQAENVQQLEVVERWPGLVLARTGFFRGELMRLLEDAQSPSRQIQYLPTPFDVSVMMHHGGIGTVTKTVQAQQIKLYDQGKSAKELYMAHLTCPICSESKGGDRILLFRRWIASARLKRAIDGRTKR